MAIHNETKIVFVPTRFRHVTSVIEIILQCRRLMVKSIRSRLFIPYAMKVRLCLAVSLFAFTFLHAQVLFTKYQTPLSHNQYTPLPARTLYQRNYGAILGLQRGAITSIEFGGEMHWRKIGFRNPRITGASANIEYNFGHHVIGYKLGAWQKQGRVNLTYGGNLVYYSNFKGLQRYGLGPAVGFRLAGFHLINGYNILAGDKELKDVNKLYMTLRYYFPIDNKFTWDRATMRRKRARRKARENRKEQRAEDRENGKRWDWHKPFVFPKKQ